MKRIITTLLLFGSLFLNAQVYNGGGGAILNNGVDTYFPINVTGLPAQIDSVFGLEKVCFTLNHPANSELYIYLRSPSGTIVELTLGSSSNGSNYTNSCFDNQSTTSSTLGSAPYTGTYKPVGYLGRFNTGQAGNGTWNLIVHDGFPGINAGTLVSWSLTFGSSIPAPPVFLKSSNLPIVFINTSQPITEANTVVNMGIVWNGANRNYVTDPWNNYNGKAEIHVRGSSTKNFEKKSYSFETQTITGSELIGPILGMPLESDWILGASYIDKTLIRIPLAYDLFRKMGHYAPRYKSVEVVINNEYQGVYGLMEKVKRDSNRVHVHTLSNTANSFPAVSGGYIVKIDRTDEAGWYSLLPGDCQSGTRFYYNYVYPKDVDITLAQKNYIKSYVDSFETAMNAWNYTDPLVGYRKYIALGSFVDYFILNELSKNVDAYRLSTYLYKKDYSKGGKMHIGPVWDYDIAWHNCNYGNTTSPVGWQYQSQDCTYPAPTWWSRMMQDPQFTNELYCRWNNYRQSFLSLTAINNYIDSSANALGESQQRNFKQFPIIGAFIFPNPQSQAGASYWGEVNDLKNWVANRIAWMDAAIVGQCNIQVAANQKPPEELSVYPNPMHSNTTFKLHLSKSAEISLSVTDLVGKEVARYLNAHAAVGESSIVFERNQLPAGVYFYQLQVDNDVRKGKLVIQ